MGLPLNENEAGRQGHEESPSLLDHYFDDNTNTGSALKQKSLYEDIEASD